MALSKAVCSYYVPACERYRHHAVPTVCIQLTGFAFCDVDHQNDSLGLMPQAWTRATKL